MFAGPELARRVALELAITMEDPHDFDAPAPERTGGDGDHRVGGWRRPPGEDDAYTREGCHGDQP
jgi:hypothetical protein